MKISKYVILVISIIMLAFLPGCSEDKDKFKEELLPDLVDDFKEETDLAIKNKDIELAREVWSDITEYSVIAKQDGDEDISEKLENLASSYVKLIDYCENNDEDSLNEFNDDYDVALEFLKEYENQK